MTLNGYDISNNQGDINNGIVPGDFAIIKATEGVGYTDPNCDANYQQSKQAGKLLGVYHFARPDGNDPISEANWFVSQIQGYLGEAVLVLDLEVNPTTPQWAKAFLDRVYELTKVRGWLYMNQARFNAGDWSALWNDYAAWPASYGANNVHNGYGAPNAPITINGNWTIVAWQYTSKGILPGWGGDLDLNISYVDRAGWLKYAAGDRNAPAPQPTPTPAPTPDPVVPPVAEEPTPVPEIPVTDTPTPVETPTEPTTPNIPVEPVTPTPPKENRFIEFLKLLIEFLKGFIK